MNKATNKLHIDLPLYSGSMLIKFKNLLNELFLHQIYPDYETNETMIEMLDAAYIQPFFHIYVEYLKDRTGHDVGFTGDGTTTKIVYKDTGAVFMYQIDEQGHSDVDFYYNDKTTDSQACHLIYLLESIYGTHYQFDIGKVAEEMQHKADEWVKGMKDRISSWDTEEPDDDYDDDEEERLWQEYLSEIQEGFDEWKAKKKANVSADLSTTPDAGTIMYYDGEKWQEFGGIRNVEISADTTDVTTFFADNHVFARIEPEVQFSFTCDSMTTAMKEMVEQLGATLKKSQSKSVPP